MNKTEFLQGLQSALSGNVPPETVRENLRYYSDYIRSEVQKGRSERDVMEELGDPRLIARTIMDATPGAGEGMFEEYRSFIPFGSAGAADGGYAGDGESQGQQGNIFTGNSSVHYYDLNKWYWKLGAVLVDHHDCGRNFECSDSAPSDHFPRDVSDVVCEGTVER
jgi:hypothetical protein